MLLIISSVVAGIILYANHKLDRECTQLIVGALLDSQAQAAELSAALQELQVTQQQLQLQLQQLQASSYTHPSGSTRQMETPEQTAMQVQFAALSDNADDVIDLRLETQDETPYNRKTPDEYWDDLQRYAAKNGYLQLNPSEQQTFLEKGAALIQQLEETESHYSIDSESIQFIEAQMGEGGVSAIQSLYGVKKQLAGYAAEGKRYRRELDAMLQEPITPTMPKITHQTPRVQGRQSEYFHPALANQQVLCDNAGNFLVDIRFVYVTNVGGIQKTYMNVEDTINLRTMQSINRSYNYPKYFVEEIYSLIRTSFRSSSLKFYGMTRKDEQTQQFISIIN